LDKLSGSISMEQVRNWNRAALEEKISPAELAAKFVAGL
jgi:hypothetical protein